VPVVPWQSITDLAKRSARGRSRAAFVLSSFSYPICNDHTVNEHFEDELMKNGGEKYFYYNAVNEKIIKTFILPCC
jgi:hypothetical protein